MGETFNVIFRGDILPGHNLLEVKARMAQLFKLDDAKLAAVFSGKPVVLKKDCDLATAEKVKAALTKSGADSEIKSSSPVASTPQPPPRPVPSASPPSVQQAVSPTPTQGASLGPAASPTMFISTPNPGNAGELMLAPRGPVLTEAERAAQRKAVEVRTIDTSHITMEKRKAVFSIDETDKPSNVAAKVAPKPVPNFDIAAMSGDLLKENEKRVFKTIKIDLSHISMAEVGADVLREDERSCLPLLEVEDLKAELAPVGSDMAQIKKPPPPPPPKTDHLKML